MRYPDDEAESARCGVEPNYYPPPPDNVIDLTAKKQERARAAVLKCGDGCPWALPDLAVHGLPDGIKIAVETKCPLCGAPHFSDVS